MKIIYSFLIALFAASCATKAGYENMLASWVGQSENALVDSWGIPDGTYNREIEGVNVKYLIYNSARNVYMPDGNNLGTPFSGSFVAHFCKTSFAIEKGKVVSWHYKGNDCRM